MIPLQRTLRPVKLVGKDMLSLLIPLSFLAVCFGGSHILDRQEATKNQQVIDVMQEKIRSTSAEMFGKDQLADFPAGVSFDMIRVERNGDQICATAFKLSKPYGKIKQYCPGD
jgi:hypothetical protein